ncbi:MAG: hypothetical protein A2X49_00270 [Lentisphaerae bacterium GWF2_52_8]|nr:MAG: hypothetical protein A2X49_00270 [Lentisphaerae bacterium GWF2_52_8]
MKIYIHTDLEGIAGIDNASQMDQKSPVYQDSCSKLMLELNAAAAGAFDAGATHVAVLDSHGGGGNFILEQLDKRCWNDPKSNKKWWGALDESYAGSFFIGAHAMAGTINGFLDHTQSSTSWYNYYVNGRKFGELAQWGMVAGAYNVPMLLVTGDEAACAEAREFFNPVETVAVKQGMGRQSASSYPIEESYAKIRAAAARAVSLIPKASPLKPITPMEFILEFQRSDYCDAACNSKGVERLDARTIRWVSNDPRKLFPGYL